MQVHLPASYGTRAPGIARRAAPADEDMALVVTELVSNAVRHAGGDILLVIKDTGGARRVEVWDTSSTPPRMRADSPEAESGRGLLLVDTLSTTWGWSACGGAQPWAKVVFAEMAQPKDDDTVAARCACGFAELDDEEVTDHLNLVFEPDDLKGNDGRVHEERDRLMCACGFSAITSEELDAHFLRAFTPGDAIGRDGRRHEPADDSHRA